MQWREDDSAIAMRFFIFIAAFVASVLALPIANPSFQYKQTLAKLEKDKQLRTWIISHRDQITKLFERVSFQSKKEDFVELWDLSEKFIVENDIRSYVTSLAAENGNPVVTPESLPILEAVLVGKGLDQLGKLLTENKKHIMGLKCGDLFDILMKVSSDKKEEYINVMLESNKVKSDNEFRIWKNAMNSVFNHIELYDALGFSSFEEFQKELPTDNQKYAEAAIKDDSNELYSLMRPGLSSGAIAGIVIGVIGFVAIGAFFVIRRKTK